MDNTSVPIMDAKSVNKKILFIINDDNYLLSHRIDILNKAKKEGYKVYLLTNFTKHKKQLAKKFTSFNLNIDRSGSNIFKNFLCMVKIYLVIFRLKPSVVHTAGLIPMVITGFVSFFFRTRFVYSISGFGFFQYKKNHNNFFNKIFYLTLKIIFLKTNIFVVCQNQHNINFLLKKKIIKKNKLKLIIGTGIDIKKNNKNIKKDSILLCTRLLWSKGIKDFVKCSIFFKENNLQYKFILVGGVDHSNPNHVDQKYLEDLHNKKIIQWVGFKKNTKKYYDRALVFLYPSLYGEGLPRVLIEAGASSVPSVVYNIPGCQDIIKNEFNGFLVSKNNKVDLFKRTMQIAKSNFLQKKFGKNAKELVKIRFNNYKIYSENKKVWQL